MGGGGGGGILLVGEKANFWLVWDSPHPPSRENPAEVSRTWGNSSKFDGEI